MKTGVLLVALLTATVAAQVREEEQEAAPSKMEPKNIDGKRKLAASVVGGLCFEFGVAFAAVEKEPLQNDPSVCLS